MTELPVRYGNPARGVGFKDVSDAADALLRSGERPTTAKVRAKIGSGSPNTIGPLLDEWWKRLAGRLDHGPAAFHRLPEAVAHIAEALWLAALDEARGRAVLEQALDKRELAQDSQRLEVRSHVLSLREAEMESRLKEKDQAIAQMNERLTLLNGALKREQTGRNELIRRLAKLESRPAPPRPSGKTAARTKARLRVRSKRAQPKRSKPTRRAPKRRRRSQ